MSNDRSNNNNTIYIKHVQKQEQHHGKRHLRAAQSFNHTDVVTMERGGRLAMFLILADVMFAMVLIEDNVTLIMTMIEQPEHKPTTAMAMAMPK